MLFSFFVEKDEKQKVNAKGKTPQNKKAKHGIEHVMFDLAKFIGRGKVPMKVSFKCLHFTSSYSYLPLAACQTD